LRPQRLADAAMDAGQFMLCVVGAWIVRDGSYLCQSGARSFERASRIPGRLPHITEHTIGDGQVALPVGFARLLGRQLRHYCQRGLKFLLRSGQIALGLQHAADPGTAHRQALLPIGVGAVLRCQLTHDRREDP
jgi:hypothetical protein